MRDETRRRLAALNGAGVVFSTVWLAGHSTHRIGDREFWFALGYLALTATNALVLARSAPG